jgi:hypothetical protein
MRVHFRLHDLSLCLKILDDIFFDSPAEEIELSYCRDKGIHSREAEHNTLSATEGVKELLGIGLELALITHIDHKLLAV